MKAETLTRVFSYAGMRLPDPDPAMDPPQVVEAYAVGYPEITNADVQGPTVEGDTLVYTIVRAVGRKGLDESEPESEEVPERTWVVGDLDAFFDVGHTFCVALKITAAEPETPGAMGVQPIF